VLSAEIEDSGYPTDVLSRTYPERSAEIRVHVFAKVVPLHRVARPNRQNRDRTVEVGCVGVGEGIDFTDQPDVSRSGRASPTFACDPQRVGVLVELENRQTPE
jgi:hypothetical protein